MLKMSWIKWWNGIGFKNIDDKIVANIMILCECMNVYDMSSMSFNGMFVRISLH